MKRRTGVCISLIGTVWLTAGAAVASAQDDTLSRVRNFYASAAYEEALQLIDRNADSAAPNSAEASAYRVFCLVALGRIDQAKRAIEATVRIDPTYHPSESLVSPRVRTLFEETRRPLLPQLARQTYSKAKTEFDRKDLSAARPDFDRALALLDELAEADDPTVADLRTLVAGFRELCKTAAAPPVQPAAPPVTKKAEPEPLAVPAESQIASDASAGVAATPTTAASSMPDRAIVYGPEFADVRPPVAVNRTMPVWSPSNSFEAKQGLRGMLEVVVNDDGSVASATIRKSVQPAYDAALLRAAASWKFRPATKNGVAVMYRLAVGIDLGRQ